MWQPHTPAMAAGLTNHIWSLWEVLLFRVPPWLQSQALYVVGEHDNRRAERTRYVRMPGRRAQQGHVTLVRGTITSLFP